MKVKDYTLEEIIEKKLLFLIPFYIFTYESRFREYEADAAKLEQLKGEYMTIMDWLDTLAEQGVISAYIRKTVIEMSEKVVENIAKKYSRIKEGVKLIMGGRVLEHEAKTILNEGRAEGILETLTGLVRDGVLTVSDAAARASLSDEAFREKMKIYGA